MEYNYNYAAELPLHVLVPSHDATFSLVNPCLSSMAKNYKTYAPRNRLVALRVNGPGLQKRVGRADM